jgi:hypothetical protein
MFPVRYFPNRFFSTSYFERGYQGTYNETMSGGGYLGQSANFNVLRNMSVAGGAWIAGSPTIAAKINPVISTVGVLISSNASVNYKSNPTINGVGSKLNGAALVSFNYVTFGGVSGSGSAKIIANESILGSGGLFAGKGATVTSHKVLRVQYKFLIGEVVYVPTAFSNQYLRQRIRNHFTCGNQIYYDVGLGEFHENSLLSYSEYKTLLCKKPQLHPRLVCIR